MGSIGGWGALGGGEHWGVGSIGGWGALVGGEHGGGGEALGCGACGRVGSIAWGWCMWEGGEHGGWCMWEGGVHAGGWGACGEETMPAKDVYMTLCMLLKLQ